MLLLRHTISLISEFRLFLGSNLSYSCSFYVLAWLVAVVLFSTRHVALRLETVAALSMDRFFLLVLHFATEL